MGQSGFMVKKRNLPPLLSFSALLVCILPHCRLRDWCGSLRKASSHVVCRLDQTASFRILIPHFTFHIPQFRILPIAMQFVCPVWSAGRISVDGLHGVFPVRSVSHITYTVWRGRKTLLNLIPIRLSRY